MKKETEKNRRGMGSILLLTIGTFFTCYASAAENSWDSQLEANIYENAEADIDFGSIGGVGAEIEEVETAAETFVQEIEVEVISVGEEVSEMSALEDSGEEIEVLSLDIISFDDFISEDPQALAVLQSALYEKGIVGIKGVPGYRQKVLQFIEGARLFSSFPEEVKEAYAPDRSSGDMFLGYEKGKERFKRPDGRWVVDDLKVSYYAYIPDSDYNIWPQEIDLRTPFVELGTLMSDVGKAVMWKIGLLGPEVGVSLDDTPQAGRMLYYRKNMEGSADNPFWCGAHFDHGMFTALLPAFYFIDGERVSEPMEAGLFVRTTANGAFKKVIANDPDVLLFQVGEFGQLMTNDAIRATEHRVQKADSAVERYTLALFFDAPMDTVVFSTSELTNDARYGGTVGEPCTYRRWHEESFKRYLVVDEEVTADNP